MTRLTVGSLLFLSGHALRVWSMRELAKAGIRGKALKLITAPQFVVHSGPYSRLRHPMYLGTVLMYAGLGILALGWGGAILPLPAVPWLMERAAKEDWLMEASDR